jgi:hypothetical protein
LSAVASSPHPQESSFDVNGSIRTDVAISPQKCTATVTPTVTSKYDEMNNMYEAFFTMIIYIFYNSESIEAVPFIV